MTNDDLVKTPTTEQQMRDAMVQRLIELGAARSCVVAAFRKVPRHLVAPETDLATAYGAESR